MPTYTYIAVKEMIANLNTTCVPADGIQYYNYGMHMRMTYATRGMAVGSSLSLHVYAGIFLS